jgi:hypothetical protein
LMACHAGPQSGASYFCHVSTKHSRFPTVSLRRDFCADNNNPLSH